MAPEKSAFSASSSSALRSYFHLFHGNHEPAAAGVLALRHFVPDMDGRLFLAVEILGVEDHRLLLLAHLHPHYGKLFHPIRSSLRAKLPRTDSQAWNV